MNTSKDTPMTTKESEVDVLAVIDDVERGMRSMSTILADDMRQARAAVAEVFAAAKHAAKELVWCGNNSAADTLRTALRNAGVKS